MVHYSCDLCGQHITGKKERYVVKIDVFSAERTDDWLFGGPPDPIEDLSDITPDPLETSAYHDSKEEYRTFQYDLCSACHREYLKNPLMMARPRNYGLSGN